MFVFLQVYEDGELEVNKEASEVEPLDEALLEKAKEAEENDIVRMWITILLMHIIYSVFNSAFSFLYFEFTSDGGSSPNIDGFFSFFYYIALALLMLLSICGSLATLFFCWKLYPLIALVISGDNLTVNFNLIFMHSQWLYCMFDVKLLSCSFSVTHIQIAVLATESTSNVLLNRQNVFDKESIRIAI